MKILTKESMSEEWLDVVDEQNRVTGQAKRKDVHEKGLRHRAAHILIYNQQGDLFLQKRSENKDTFPGYWDSSAAGHVDAGESYDQCITREVTEELGIVLEETPEKLFLLQASPETGMEFCQVYKTIYDGPFDLNEEEIEEGKWFSEIEIEEWLKTGGEGLTTSIKIMILKSDPELRDRLGLNN